MSNKLTLKKILLFLGDVFLLYFSLFLTVALGFLGQFDFEIFSLHLLPFSILYVFWLIILYVFGLYDLHLVKTKTSFYASIFTTVIAELVLGMLFFYTLPFFEITPKTNLVINVLIFGLLILAWRKLFYALFSVHFLGRVIVIGQNSDVENLKKEINDNPYLGYKIISVDIKNNLISQIQKHNINTVIFTEEFESNPELLKALYLYSPSQVSFLEFTKAYELIYEKIPIQMISQTWFLDNLREGQKDFYDRLIKRIFDLTIASVLLILSFPFWILIALAIKLEDRGPVFYSQKRIGRDRKVFVLYKFRSMKTDAEKNGAVWAKKNDERITKVGRILRRIHFDELPQMINVLKGNISLVGPRPERPEFVKELEKEIPHYHLRHVVKSGFTGWAQIKFRYGRSVVDSFEKFQYDLYYLKNRNFLLDIGILLRTFQLFFKKE